MVNTTLRLALYQPDMAPNTGAMMRLCACFGVGLDIIEPCGFVLDDRRLKRAAMDYAATVTPVRHRDWAAFQAARAGAGDAAGRLLLLTTKGDTAYRRFAFRPGDVLLVGRESAGVPDDVHAAVDARLVIPLAPPARSLNVGMAAAIVLGEAVRQLESKHA